MQSSWTGSGLISGIVSFIFLLAGSDWSGTAVSDRVSAAEGKKGKKPEGAKDVSFPEAAREAVLKKFPGARIDDVSRNKGGLPVRYTVTLHHKDNDYEVVVTSKGKIVEISKEIEEDELPKAVRDALQKRYPNCRILEAYEVTEFNVPNPLTFFAEIVTAGNDPLDVTFDPLGKLLLEERR